MWNNREPQQGQTRSSTPRRWLVLGVLGGALLPALATAQVLTRPLVIVLKSGLHSIYERHTLLLTVTEVGAAASESGVTIEFRDASDQRRAFTSGRLLRTRPVRLPVQIPAGVGRDQLRVIVRITPLIGGEASEPIVGLEDLDADSFQVAPKVVCSARDHDPSGTGNAEADCGGFAVTRLTLEQASMPD